MCGIAGYLGLELAPAERAPLLERMCDAIRHRGPDDRGTYSDDLAGLGMQRLSIIDVEGGHQPVASERGDVQVVFNGEIYNHGQLREALAARGHRFHTRCDTEVVLRQYEADGARCVERFNGMFAIAIWDAARRSLLLLRDRLGVKPLYYYWDGRRLLFASEIKALIASGIPQREVDHEAVWDYLTFRYVPGPRSIWKHIHKLQPGHQLSLSAGDREPRVERYWEMPCPAVPRRASDAELDEEFAALFTDAVNLRMVADVPVGVLLSGGLDSSAVAAAVARSPGAQLATFSVAFADSPETDESPWAREVAAHLGCEHHEVVIGRRQFCDFLPELVRYSDEPMADLASVPLYHVCRLARERVKVVQSGEGSDEVLGGYTFDTWMARWEASMRARRSLRWLGGLRMAAGLARLFPALGGTVQAAGWEVDQRLEHEPVHMTNLMDSAAKRRLMRAAEPGWADSFATMRAELRRIGPRHPLHQTLHLYCQSWLVEDLLMKADRMSMANSLELRTPFLDYRLVEWAARVAPEVKVGRAGGAYVTKRVLRRFAAPLLPQAIIDRPKRGFPVPVYDWLGGVLAAWAREMLEGSEARLGEWCEPGGLRDVVARGTADGAASPDRHRLWNLLVLEMWMREWLPA